MFLNLWSISNLGPWTLEFYPEIIDIVRICTFFQPSHSYPISHIATCSFPGCCFVGRKAIATYTSTRTTEYSIFPGITLPPGTLQLLVSTFATTGSTGPVMVTHQSLPKLTKLTSKVSEVHILWAQHQVHHSSEEFNMAVGVRQSILQGWCGFVRTPQALLNPTVVTLVSWFVGFLFADGGCGATVSFRGPPSVQPALSVLDPY